MAERDAGDEMNREFFIAPSLIGDSELTPLLDQAEEDVEEQATDNLEQDQARRAELREGPKSKEVDGIVFDTGPEPKTEEHK
ncbi:MAG TPA: hypothetical protein VN905_15025 [Candidatus Binatia bacterium]|nr:hypothetical protein [Candidatus Binatia bacterium]